MTDIAKTDELGWAISHATHQSVLNHIQVLEARIKLLRQPLVGVGTNATHCGMCQLLNQIANDVLRRDDAVAKLKELPLMFEAEAWKMGLIE